MLDLDNISMSPSSVSLTCCPSFIPAVTGPELLKSIESTVDYAENLAGDCNPKPMLLIPPEEEVRRTENAIWHADLTGRQGPSDRIKKVLNLEDYVRDWVNRRVESGVSES